MPCFICTHNAYKFTTDYKILINSVAELRCAYSEAEVIGEVLIKYREQFPAKDGWTVNVIADEIELSVLKEFISWLEEEQKLEASHENIEQ